MDGEQTIIIRHGTGRTATVARFRIPSEAQIVATALELRQQGKGVRDTYGMMHLSCGGVYWAPRIAESNIVDPFTGARGNSTMSTLGDSCTIYHIRGVSTAVATVQYTDPPTVRLLGTLALEEQAELLPPSSGVEGAPRTVELSQYERDPALRAACLKIHGVKCFVCDIELEQVYGPITSGFIHVHHIEPLGEVREAHTVDPAKDLIPLCPNCHAVVHLRTPPFTPSEVRAMIRSARH